MAKKKQKDQEGKQRDIYILAAFRKEVNLKTRVKQSKKIYTRKEKHKKNYLPSILRNIGKTIFLSKKLKEIYE
jgi:hypothetical protein